MQRLFRPWQIFENPTTTPQPREVSWNGVPQEIGVSNEMAVPQELSSSNDIAAGIPELEARNGTNSPYELPTKHT